MAQALTRRIERRPQDGLGESLEKAKSLAATALVLAVISCASSSSAPPGPLPDQSWPMFRGDLARDGHPPSATLNDTAARRLALSWQARLEGAVDGTPAVSDGMVVAGSMGGELAAYAEASGRTVWEDSGLGPISSSATIDGDRVLIGTLNGHVLALDLSDGKQLWDWTSPGDQPAIWASPTVYRGVVVIGSASPYGDTPLEPGRISGLDAATGRQLWTTCLRGGCQVGDGVWSTPSIDAGGVAYVGVGNPEDGVRAFDPRTGAPLWGVSLYPDAGNDLDVGSSPVVFEDAGREVLAVTSVAGTIALLDARTGGMIWSRSLVAGSAVHGLLATAAFDGTSLFAASASPPTGVFALRPDGSQRWMHATGLAVYSAPAAARGVVVFGTGNVFGDLSAGSVVAVSTLDGSTLWSYDTGSAVRSSPAVAGDLVAIGDHSGDLLVFRPRS